MIYAAGTFLLEESGLNFKGGENVDTVHFSMESGVVVVWGRHSKGRKYELEVKEGGGGGGWAATFAAKRRDRHEGKSQV